MYTIKVETDSTYENQWIDVRNHQERSSLNEPQQIKQERAEETESQTIDFKDELEREKLMRYAAEESKRALVLELRTARDNIVTYLREVQRLKKQLDERTARNHELEIENMGLKSEAYDLTKNLQKERALRAGAGVVGEDGAGRARAEAADEVRDLTEELDSERRLIPKKKGNSQTLSGLPMQQSNARTNGSSEDVAPEAPEPIKEPTTPQNPTTEGPTTSSSQKVRKTRKSGRQRKTTLPNLASSIKSSIPTAQAKKKQIVLTEEHQRKMQEGKLKKREEIEKRNQKLKHAAVKRWNNPRAERDKLPE